MLPFLAPKKTVSVIMAKRKPDGPMEDMHEEGESHPELLMAAEDLIRAVHGKDAHAVADALEHAFYVCDSYGDVQEISDE